MKTFKIFKQIAGTMIVLIMAIACVDPVTDELKNDSKETAIIMINSLVRSVIATTDDRSSQIIAYQIKITVEDDLKYDQIIQSSNLPLRIENMVIGEVTIEISALDSEKKILALGMAKVALTPGLNEIKITLRFEPPEIDIYHSSGEGFEVWIDNEDDPQNIEFTSLDLAFDWIKENAVDGGKYIVRLGQNANIEKQQLYYDDKTVSITLISRDGLEKQISSASRIITLFDVMPNVTLTLDKGVTLKDPGFFYYQWKPVSVKGKLIMKADSTILKCRDDSWGWIGVTVEATGEFIMDGGTINGDKNGSTGVILLGRFTMNNGVITGCSGNIEDRGSGIFVYSNASLIINDGTISDCSAYEGGGVCVYAYGFFVMNGGYITKNTAGLGGGIYIHGTGTFNMYGGTISNNTAQGGGGVYVDWGDGIFTMHGGKILGNTARSGNGGGVTVRDSTFIKTGGTIYGYDDMTNANTTVDYYTNEVINGKGHAVYAYSNNTGLTTRRENTAGPVVKLSYNYNNSSPIAAGDWNHFTTHTVTFDPSGGNWAGGTYSKNITVEKNANVPPPENPMQVGRIFEGWYTSSTGGTQFSFLMPINNDMVLYARWTPISYTIIYDKNANDATGNTATSSYIYDAERALTANTYARIGYIFAGWNTEANGTGISYTDNQKVKNLTTTSGDIITLYAKWEPWMPVSMVWVPGGSFPMGNDAANSSDNEKPVHTVNVSGFYMAKYLVTQAQYKAVMGYNPSIFTGDDNRPIEAMSWYDAIEFCNKLSEIEGLIPVYTITGKSISGSLIRSATVTSDWNNNGYRLPFEAEWEYAANGGNGSPGNFTYSGSNDLDTIAWYSDNSDGTTHPVGTKAANGLGIYDMTGNVWEHCWDIYGAYPNVSQTDPQGASSGAYRVYRGGNYSSQDSALRLTARNRESVDNMLLLNTGIRLVRK
jgi:uncharacterized repeat protein (TIGR02543 family)